MRWIKEHKLIATLLSLLIVLALIFVLSVATGMGGGSFSDFINNGTSKISGFFSSVGGGIRDGATGIFANASMQDEIDRLEEEKAQLERELLLARLEAGQLQQLQDLAGILNYDYTSEVFNVTTADVTMTDGSSWMGIITINKGTEAGIEPGATVLSGAGLVGRITDAGEGWARVMPVVNEDSRMSGKLARDYSQLSILSGNADGTFTGYMLDEGSTVVAGDLILASGMGNYSEGIEIGTVKTVTYNSDRLLKEIVVEPVVNFQGLRKVAVVI